MIVVLPTADLVHEYQRFDPLFVFYDDGIRGVVRDAVILSQGWSWVWGEERREAELLEALQPFMDKVLRDYANSAEALRDQLAENTSAEMYVELVVENIWRRVNGVMYDLFRHLVYDVSKAEHKWLGNDLITVLSFFD